MSNAAAPLPRSARPSMDLDALASGHLEGTVYDGHHDALFEEDFGGSTLEAAIAEEEATQPSSLETSFSSNASFPFPELSAAAGSGKTKNIARQPSLDVDLSLAGLDETPYAGEQDAIVEGEVAVPRSVQFADPSTDPDHEPELVPHKIPRDRSRATVRLGVPLRFQSNDLKGDMPMESGKKLSRQESLDLDLAATDRLEGTVYDVKHEAIFEDDAWVEGMPAERDPGRKAADPHNLVYQEESILADTKSAFESRPKREETVDNDLAVIDRYITLSRDQKHDNFLLLVEADKHCNGFWDGPRYVAYKITESRVFEYGILLIIMANIVTLALYEPAEPPNIGKNLILTNTENVFLLFYWLELILRVVSDGVLKPKNTTRPAYLQQTENWLDFVIVIAGTVEFILWMSGGKDDPTGGGGGGGIAALRALRALRVMKFIKSLQSLRLVIKVLIDSIPQIMTVVTCLGCIMAILAILGMQLYMGRLNSACYFDDTFEQVEIKPCIKYLVDENNVDQNSTRNSGANFCQEGQTCITSQIDPFHTTPYQTPEGWPELVAENISVVFNGTMSFDHFGVAFYTVYTLGTMEGWTEVLYSYDATGGKSFNWLYFVIVVVIQGYILVSLMIGVLTGLYVKEAELAANAEEANVIKRELSRGASRASINERFQKMTTKRKSTLSLSSADFEDPNGDKFIHPGFATAEEMAAQHPKREDTPVPFPKLKKAVSRAWFKYGMMLVIVANTIFLCLDKYPSTPEYDGFLKKANYVFVGLFCLELIIKLIAYTPVNYFARDMYRFDTLVVFCALMELLLVDAIGISGSLSLSAFRALRLLRIMRLSSDWYKLRMYAYGSIRALRGLASLGLLSFLFLTICSLVGMQVFGSTGKFWSRTNYNNFGNAFIASFQLMTAEGWNEVMFEGIESVGGIKGWGGLSGVYFIGVVAMGNYVLLGVLLAIAYKNLSDMLPEPGPRQLSEKDLTMTLKDAQSHIEDKSMVRDSACGCISSKNFFRQACHKIMISSWFDPLILLCIMTSSILLAVEDYVNPDAARNATLKYFDYIFVAIFSLEMIIKMVGLGLFMHKRAYFRSGWNVLDFVIVLSSIITLAIPTDIMNNSSLSGLIRVVRTFRVLRPLRAIEESPGLQAVVGAMIDAVVKLWGMLITALLVVLCFSICGTALFKGTFQYCTDNQIRNESMCVGNFSYTGELNQTVTDPRTWQRHDLNFDLVHKSFLTLLSILQFEDWPVVYHHAVDASEKGMGPIEGNNPSMFVFFFCYLVFVCLFFINIVMAFVVLMFRNQSEALHRQTGLTRAQVLCLRYALEVKQPRDIFHMRRGNQVLKYVDTQAFEYGILSLVVGNVICMVMEYAGQSKGYESGLNVANIVFVSLFGIEYILKTIAYGPIGYFRDNWNRFDFLVLVGSFADILLAASDYPISILRVFRAARLVKLLNQGDAKYLFQTCLSSLLSISFVGMIYMLILFIYSVIGMVLFARLPLDESTTINADNNFRNIGNSALLLFRVMTGESWQAIMADTHIDEISGRCNLAPEDGGGTTCGSGANQIFFVSYVIITNLLILNILVAVIVDNFEFLYMDKSELQPLHLQQFANEWVKYDPRGQGSIHHGHLLTILRAIDPPFGLGKRCPSFLAHKFLSRLHIPVDRRQHIAFRPALVGVIRARLNLWMTYTPSQEMLMRVYSVVSPKVSLDILEDAAPPDHQSEFSVRMLYTVYRLQYIFRANRERRLHPERIDSMALAKALAHAEVEQEERRITILAEKVKHVDASASLNRMSSFTHDMVTEAASTLGLENSHIRQASKVAIVMEKLGEGGDEAGAEPNMGRRTSVASLVEAPFGDEEWDADNLIAKQRGALAFFLEHGHPDMNAPDVVVSANGKIIHRPESAGNKDVMKALMSGPDVDLIGKLKNSGSQQSKVDGFGFTPGTVLPEKLATPAGPNRGRLNWMKAKDVVSSARAFLTGGYMDI